MFPAKRPHNFVCESVSAKRKEDPVSELEQRLLDTGATSYSAIDKIMRSICSKYGISAQKLHDDFKSKHKMIPDKWVKTKGL